MFQAGLLSDHSRYITFFFFFGASSKIYLRTKLIQSRVMETLTNVSKGNSESRGVIQIDG